MISRCPSCGTPAPDEARTCRACGWDFVANKKGEKKPEPPKKTDSAKKNDPPAERPKSSAPPAVAGFSLPPARGGSADGAKAPHPKSPSGGAAEENPFALPVARNLGPKPGEGIFAPPPAAAPELPAAKPKEAPPPEPAEPPKKTPPEKIEAPKPSPEPVAEEALEEEPDDGESAALFLPTSTKEIVVNAPVKRVEPPAPLPKAPVAAAKSPAPISDPKAPAGRQSAVPLAALAGAALGLLSVGAIFMMLRSEPPTAARPTGSSPFGKRVSGDATLTPLSADSSPASVSPAPITMGGSQEPLSMPAPVVRKASEPPSPGPVETPPAAVAPNTETASSRPTATFAKSPRSKPVMTEKPKPEVPAPPRVVKKPAGPQWVFEGVVYDLLTTRGVFGVRLIFLDDKDTEVAVIETSEGGRYRAAMRPGPAEGYTLLIMHDDYSGKHIDELDSTSSVRKADLEQRKFLMDAGARSLPWIGAVGKPVRRDMALVPKVSAE